MNMEYNFKGKLASVFCVTCDDKIKGDYGWEAVKSSMEQIKVEAMYNKIKEEGRKNKLQ